MQKDIIIKKETLNLLGDHSFLIGYSENPIDKKKNYKNLHFILDSELERRRKLVEKVCSKAETVDNDFSISHQIGEHIAFDYSKNKEFFWIDDKFLDAFIGYKCSRSIRSKNHSLLCDMIFSFVGIKCNSIGSMCCPSLAENIFLSL